MNRCIGRCTNLKRSQNAFPRRGHLEGMCLTANASIP
jgi:hypothetical protein